MAMSHLKISLHLEGNPLGDQDHPPEIAGYTRKRPPFAALSANPLFLVATFGTTSMIATTDRGGEPVETWWTQEIRFRDYFRGIEPAHSTDTNQEIYQRSASAPAIV